MKSFVYAVVAASTLSAPLVSMAQAEQNQPVTRAQVREELIRLQQAGYQQTAQDAYYPENIQAAQRRVAGQQGPTAANADTGYGGTTSGAGQSGSPAQSRPMNVDGVHPLYFGR